MRSWFGVNDISRYQPPAAADAAMNYLFTYGTPNTEKAIPTFDSMANVAYAGNGVVFGVIHARLKFFSEARFKFRSLADKRLYGTDALRKLEKPWPGGTTGELLARMEQDASLYGNAYIRDAGDRLERLRPDWVTIVSEIKIDAYGEQVREVVGYMYEPIGDTDRDIAFYPVEEVAHWSPIPDPMANFRGMSWLTPVLREVNADNLMTDHREAYYKNAATPNMIIRYPQELTQEQVDRIGKTVAARHAGPENAYRTMVLDVGADPMIVGDQINDAVATVQAAGENRIAVAAGVPAIVVGLKEGLNAATLANYESAVKSFADLTMRPLWRSACASLAKLVQVPGGAELWYDTSDIIALQDGEQTQAETFSADAQTASTLITSGYTPDSVATAIKARDLSLLQHTGRYSVQLLPPGADSPKENERGDNEA
ncbi:phage portal protein [Micromonospora sp. NPDC049891]|uniref:phage portal protein n=1 Tax=Micromonospora sp. NPDC049891 TaxID=3155655 RepID=UPI0033F31D31